MKTKRTLKAAKKMIPAQSATSAIAQPEKGFSAHDVLLESAMRRCCPKLEDAAPQWAQQARQMFLVALKLRNRKSKASEFYNIGLESGWNHGLGELIFNDARVAEGLRDLASKALKESKDALKTKVATEVPEEMAADFFAGMSDGTAGARRVPNQAQKFERTKCFREIAMGWRELVEENIIVGNQADDQALHEWLDKKGFLKLHADSKAEARKIRRLIGCEKRGNTKKPHKQG
jgi:hypothetical protein